MAGNRVNRSNRSIRGKRRKRRFIKLFRRLLLLLLAGNIVLFCSVHRPKDFSGLKDNLFSVLENVRGTVTAAVSGTASSSEDTFILEEEHLIEDFEVILQNPELPTGCESVALTMLINYYGIYTDKILMADSFLPKQDAAFYYDESGRKIGPDMENYFAGDPCTSEGYICGVPAILTEANDWISYVGEELRAVDKTGLSWDELYSYVCQDTPVMVWVTINMEDRLVTNGWYTEDGEWMEYARNDHAAVLVGYTSDTVTVADSISGLVAYSREQFEKVFESRGCKCVVLE